MSQTLEKACADYKSRNDLLSFVKEAQEKEGHLSPQTIKDIASLWGTTVSEVYGVATFYSFLSIKPLGQNVIRVCNSTSCWLKNHQSVIKVIEEQLGIKPGETTKDKQFSLQLVNCIGACDNAPAMMINDKVYSSLKPEKVKKILSNFKKQKAGSGGDASS